jgi:hypothetical protein
MPDATTSITLIREAEYLVEQSSDEVVITGHCFEIPSDGTGTWATRNLTVRGYEAAIELMAIIQRVRHRPRRGRDGCCWRRSEESMLRRPVTSRAPFLFVGLGHVVEKGAQGGALRVGEIRQCLLEGAVLPGHLEEAEQQGAALPVPQSCQ